MSDELPDENDVRAKRAFFYFCHLVGEPDFEEGRDLFTRFMGLGWDYTGEPGDFEDSLRPALNPNLTLLECLMIFDGWLPWKDDPYKRYPAERLRSSTLALNLDMTPQSLAHLLRYFDQPKKGLRIRPKTMRFYGTAAKGYDRHDFERAWEEDWGRFFKRLEALSAKPA
jgi:hypothetical protein